MAGSDAPVRHFRATQTAPPPPFETWYGSRWAIATMHRNVEDLDSIA